MPVSNPRLYWLYAKTFQRRSFRLSKKVRCYVAYLDTSYTGTDPIFGYIRLTECQINNRIIRILLKKIDTRSVPGHTNAAAKPIVATVRYI